MKTNITLILLCLVMAMACHKNNFKPNKIVYHRDGEVDTLLYNGPNEVNIVILGDAFTIDDLEKGGVYDKQVKDITDFFFMVPPYKQYKRHFNLFVVYAESKYQHALNGYDPTNTNTRFNSYYDSKITRLLLVGKPDTAFKYFEKALPLEKIHLKVMLVNDDKSGGSGGEIAIVSSNSFSKYTFIHEAGHTLANLADEYADDQLAATWPAELVRDFPNADDTNDPAKTKWVHFLNLNAYKGIVGSYEGAFYRSVGFYRPEQSSVMYEANTVSYNAPSREAIIRRIDEIEGVPFDFNAFLKQDASSILPIKVSFIPPNLSPMINDFVDLKGRNIKIQQQQKRTN